MPSTVINDPESIHSYRSQIAQNVEKLRKLIPDTQRALDTVGESWKDSQFQQFSANFETEMQEISPLCEVLSNYEGNLLYRLENNLRTYTDFGMRI